MRLLESKRDKRGKFAGGTIASILVHSLVIFLAIFATARAGNRHVEKTRAEKVDFVEVKKKEPPPPVEKKELPKPKVAPKPVPVAPPRGFKVLPPTINIPTSLPAIDLSKQVTNEADFSGKGVEGGTASGVKGGTGKAGDTGKEAGVAPDAPYFEFQVEKPASRIGGATPDYPLALRSASIEGEVLAQFVVGENGRYESGTLKILNSSNPLFTAAVKDALPGMRFSAAEIGGKKVKQLVQMPFEFHLVT